MFYLDGAHSPESMEVCATWFSRSIKRENEYQKSVVGGSIDGSRDSDERLHVYHNGATTKKSQQVNSLLT